MGNIETMEEIKDSPIDLADGFIDLSDKPKKINKQQPIASISLPMSKKEILAQIKTINGVLFMLQKASIERNEILKKSKNAYKRIEFQILEENSNLNTILLKEQLMSLEAQLDKLHE
jgi:hypothetical protein